MWILFANTGAKNLPAPATKIAGYNLSKPDNYWTLPDILKEMSGIVSVDGSSVACVTQGIAFLSNGDVLFSNEGENGKPSLMRFNYKNKQ